MTGPAERFERESRDQAAPPWLARAAFTVAGVILAVLAVVWIVGRLRSLLVMLFVSLFVAVALEPAVQRLAGRGWKRGVATGVVFLIAFLVLVGFMAALVPLFVSQTEQIVEAAPGYVDALQEWIGTQDLFDPDIIGDQVLGTVQDLGGVASSLGTRLAGGLFAIGNTVVGGVFALVTVGLFSFYMVADGPRMRRTVLSFLPAARQREVLRIWEIAVSKTGGYIYSRLILAIVAAVFSGIVFAIIGLPYVAALAISVGIVSQFVPVVGAYIAAFLPVLVALGSRPLDALWVILALAGYQQIENFFVAPRITARSMSLHPAVSLASVIAGASLLGAMGAVLALPVAATVQAFLSTALARHEIVDPSHVGSSGEARAHEPAHPSEGGLGDAGAERIEGVGATGEHLES